MTKVIRRRVGSPDRKQVCADERVCGACVADGPKAPGRQAGKGLKVSKG